MDLHVKNPKINFMKFLDDFHAKVEIETRKLLKYTTGNRGVLQKYLIYY